MFLLFLMADEDDELFLYTYMLFIILMHLLWNIAPLNDTVEQDMTQ